MVSLVCYRCILWGWRAEYVEVSRRVVFLTTEGGTFVTIALYCMRIRMGGDDRDARTSLIRGRRVVSLNASFSIWGRAARQDRHQDEQLYGCMHVEL